MIGEHNISVEHGQHALDIATGLDDISLRVRANYCLGQAYHGLGKYRQAIAVLQQNATELQGDLICRRFGLLGAASVLSRSSMVWCLAELGDFDQALQAGEEAIRIAEELNEPYSRIAAYHGMGSVHARRGELSKAIAVLESALELCREWDTHLPMWFAGVAPSLGHAYAMSGKAIEAIQLFEKAIEQVAAVGFNFAQSLSIGWLARAQLLAGRPVEAWGTASEALDVARRHHERGHEALIKGVIGQIAAEVKPAQLAEAESAYRDGLLIASELGMRPLVAHCHLGLGKLYRGTDKREQAEEHLTTATTMYRDMGMTYWLEKAEAEVA
jgi:tetratricopeptide (TPR) repeat protein